jgi:hypothetical protein
LRIRLRDTPHTWTEWNCSQLLQNTPLHPVRVASDLAVPIPAKWQLADLESTLGLIKIDPAENVPLLAPSWTFPFRRDVCPLWRPKKFGVGN